jgi:hypothetical protein
LAAGFHRPTIMTIFLRNAVLALTLVICSAAHAQIIFSNMPSTTTIPPTSGILVSNGTTFGTYKQAFKFGAVESGFLHSVNLPISQFLGDASPIKVSIYLDGGVIPGGFLPPLGGPIAVSTAFFNDDVLLSAGASYWVAVSAVNSETGFGWAQHPDQLLPRAWGTTAADTYVPIGVNGATYFQVNGVSAVPEPSTYALFGVLFVFVAIWRKRFGST